MLNSLRAHPMKKEDSFKVRFPDGLHSKIFESAKSEHRSMNAEIIHRLETCSDLQAENIRLKAIIDALLSALPDTALLRQKA
ncbi:Arc family DNA-binding protein [Pseudomonas cichorii]|nr:Arc family DNA-binding protein [Pseudomonas cichorii]